MKVLNYSFAMAVASLICTGNVIAQSPQAPTPVDQAAFNYDSYYATDASTVSQPLGPDGPPVDVRNNPEVFDDDGGLVHEAPMPGLNWGFGCDCGYEIDCGDMCSLQSCENCYGINYGGWFSGGVTVNSWGNTTMLGNSQLPLNNDPHINLNQAWLWIEKEADTESYNWDWGFHADVIAGVDGPDTSAFGGPGWDSTWGWGGGQYGAAIPQLYGEIASGDLSVIFGHFYTIMGYEVVPAPYNFFYSHAYTMAYGEPFTQTGILAEYGLSDRITLYGGWTNGWDQGFQFARSGSMFLGGVNYTSDDERTSLTWTVNAGYWGDGSFYHPNDPATMSDGNLYSQSIVWQQMIADNWTYVFQTDYSANTNTTQTPGVTQTEWYGVNNYLFYNFNCCWAAGLRAEWFSDPYGVRVDRAGLNSGVTAADRANYFEITAGVNWRPSNNFRLRPEIRYDWDNGMGAANNRYDPAGGVYNHADLWTFGIDGIYLF
jgi:hypothetical protein